MTSGDAPVAAAMRRRRSHSKVTDAAPTARQLLPLIEAAASVADHASLRPWRIIAHVPISVARRITGWPFMPQRVRHTSLFLCVWPKTTECSTFESVPVAALEPVRLPCRAWRNEPMLMRPDS